MMINNYICNDFYYFNQDMKLMFCVEFVYDCLWSDFIGREHRIRSIHWIKLSQLADFMALLILDILSSGEINAPGKSTLGYT